MPEPQPTRWNPAAWPLAAALAWLFPGLGHWAIGERARGAIVGLTLLSLFAAGLLVGGLDVVDFRRDRIWFAGQALMGPLAIGVERLHVALDPEPIGIMRDRKQTYVYPFPQPPTATREPEYYPSIGRVNELGTLYCTLAGVLNLLVILDVVGRVTHIPSEDDLPTSGGRPMLEASAR